MTWADRARLDLAFDADAVAAEAAALPTSAWEPHFNLQQYEGDWSGIALRAAVGSALALYPDPSATEYEATAWLARCPATAALLEAIPCPLLTARFLRLGPGSRILRHRDHCLSAADGEARLHLPVVSDDEVEFRLADEAVAMAPGECWYLDLSRHHEVDNRGSEARVHLVVDVTVTEWLLAQLGT